MIKSPAIQARPLLQSRTSLAAAAPDERSSSSLGKQVHSNIMQQDAVLANTLNNNSSSQGANLVQTKLAVGDGGLLNSRHSSNQHRASSMRSGGQCDAPDAAVTANQVSANPFGVYPPFSHSLVSALMGSFQLGWSIKIWSWLVFSETVRHFSLLPRESAQSRTLTSRIKLLPLIWPN